jgi:5-methylcytosine-specific restriction protein B
MNTADRSLAGLDLALRRRFDFKEMMPDVATLNGYKSSNIEIDKLLTVINQRIEVLLDREHTIGHAYFIGLNNTSTISDLASIFKNKVIPLLQEYFYEDWEKINMVLGCNNFIAEKKIDSNLFAKSKNDAMQLNSKTIWSISGTMSLKMQHSI